MKKLLNISKYFLQVTLLFFIISFLFSQHSIIPIKADQTTQRVFYEDFSGVTEEGTIGTQLFPEGSAP